MQFNIFNGNTVISTAVDNRLLRVYDYHISIESAPVGLLALHLPEPARRHSCLCRRLPRGCQPTSTRQPRIGTSCCKDPGRDIYVPRKWSAKTKCPGSSNCCVSCSRLMALPASASDDGPTYVGRLVSL